MGTLPLSPPPILIYDYHTADYHFHLPANHIQHAPFCRCPWPRSPFPSSYLIHYKTVAMNVCLTFAIDCVSAAKPTSVSSERSDTPKKAYEISKSLDFMEDFGISLKISRFQLRFRDFNRFLWISSTPGAWDGIG